MMIFPTKQDFIRYIASLEMGAAVIITNDHGDTVEGLISHKLAGIAGHSVHFSHAKDDPAEVEFSGPEWHFPSPIAVLHGTRVLTRDELIFLLIDHTPIRAYQITLAYPG